MAEPGETLIPGDDEDARVDAAEASALADEEEIQPEDDLVPFGMTWAFNFETGRFQNDGGDAAKVYGEDALMQWCLMAVNSTRFTHDVFSEAFGIENLDDIIGALMASEMADEFEARLRDALLVHDRIVDIEDVEVTFDPAADDAVRRQLHGRHRRGGERAACWS